MTFPLGMRIRIALMIALLFQGGCSALLNADRPAYQGPIRSAAWHNGSVRVEKTPLISEGVVLAIASPLSSSEPPRVYAFDLANGAHLWTASFAAREILAVAGSSIVVSDTETRIHVLDRGTGRENGTGAARSFSKATYDGGLLYAAGPSAIEALELPALAVRWRAPVSLANPLAPTAAGGRVYAAGTTPPDILRATPGLTAVYAFDAQSGTPVWKWEIADKTGSLFAVTSAADDARVYLWLRQVGADSFSKGLLLTLDAATGKEIWRHATSGYPAGPGPAISNLGPVLLGPNLIVVPDVPPGRDANASKSGHLFRALDRATAVKTWESQTTWKYDNTSFCGEFLLVSDHQVHKLMNENNEASQDAWVSLVRLRTGQELWRSPALELAVLTAPAGGAGMVVVGSKPYVYNSVRGKDEVSGLWAWRLGGL